MESWVSLQEPLVVAQPRRSKQRLGHPATPALTDTCEYYDTAPDGSSRPVGLVKVDLAELYIARNGTDVNSESALLDVWVSEKVSVSVGVRGEAVFIPGDASFQWCVPGQVVNGYTGYGDGSFDESNEDPDTSEVAHDSPLTGDELDNLSIDFYWVAQGSEEVSVSVSTIGQTSFESSTFDVSRPSVSVTVTTSSLRIVNNNWAELGSATSEGIEFVRSLDALADTLGSYRWTQLITKDNYTWNDATGFHTGYKTLGADNYVTYQYANEVIATDRPGAPLLANWTATTRDFGASMYLMWRHQSPDSIWVPLSVTEWGYYSNATQTNGVWTLSPSSTIRPPMTQDTTIFPEWDEFFLNDEDIIEGPHP